LTSISKGDRVTNERSDVEDPTVIELAESIQENGLLQPIVVEENPEGSEFQYKLIAGGRRYAAYTLLDSNKVEGEESPFSQIPAMLRNELPEHLRIKLELEENFQREDMTWQQKVLGIAKYHSACRRAALREGDKWTQQATGRALNMSQANVSIALDLAKALKAGHKKAEAAETMMEAIKILADEALQRGQQEQMRRIKLKREEMEKQAKTQGITLASSVSVLLPASPEAQQVTSNESTIIEPQGLTPTDVSEFYFEGSALDMIPKIAASQVINHIVCDPPYGIDMANLVMEGVEKIEETHRVKDNLELIPAFLEVAFNHIAEDGFLCMWYDLDHHEKIATWASKIGWRVQRWPLVWCKTPPCRNSQAQYNITKATEVCYFMRRSEKSIIKTKQAVNYISAPSVATSQHPFVKPEAVWNYIIDTVSTEGQTVLDGFAGNGSSLAALFKKKRIPIGIEIDPAHIAGGLNYVCEQVNKKDFLHDLFTDNPL